MAHLRFTLLGTGSSGGVPRIGGDWGACDPSEPRNRRRRCSLLVQRWPGAAGPIEQATTVLIDTAPDFREQALDCGLRHVDGVLFSHDHADQSHGIDDLRALALIHRRQIPVWMDAPTRASLRTRFNYCFQGGKGYPPILDDRATLVPGQAVAIDGPGGVITAVPLAQEHGPIGSLGFRFGTCAYSNDVSALAPASLEALSGLDIWIVDALRHTPHPSHAHLAQSLAWIAQIAPRRAILTNLHVDMDYRSLQGALPAGVEPGYDGLSFDITDAGS